MNTGLGISISNSIKGGLKFSKESVNTGSSSKSSSIVLQIT
jgi:hypothetical protein